MFARKQNITIIDKQILTKISDAELLMKYFGISKLGLMKSPLRDDDKPSFSLYENKMGRIRYKDFANDDNGSIIDLIKTKFNMNFNEVLKMISSDFNIENECLKAIVPQKRVEEGTEIKIRKRELNKKDIEYWESFGIDARILDRFLIYPIDYYWVKKGGKTKMFRADNLSYAFTEFISNKAYFKIYQPLRDIDKGKWINNYPKDTISLMNRSRKTASKVVICSSVKDALCLSGNFDFKFPCICTQGEGYDLPLKKIEEYYTNPQLFLLYDNDEAGLRDAEKLSKKYCIPNIVLPSFDNGKDISDLFKSIGKEAFIQMLRPTLEFAGLI